MVFSAHSKEGQRVPSGGAKTDKKGISKKKTDSDPSGTKETDGREES